MAWPAAVHVIRGASAGGSLKSAGAAPVIMVPDNLALGPSSAVASLHRRLRLRYWRQEWAGTIREEYDRENLPDEEAIVAGPGLARAALQGERGRVVLWGSGCWSDLLFLGWALTALERAGIARDRVNLAGPLSAASPLGYLNPEQLIHFGARLRPVGERRHQAALRLWSAYTSRSPADLERTRRDRDQPFPTFAREAVGYAAFLPQTRHRDGRRLYLSAIDEALLSALSERQWRSLPDLLRTPPSKARWPTSAIFAMLRYYGDFFIETRLRRWCDPSHGIVEFTEKESRYRLAFRLTPRGSRLLNEGIDDLRAMPPVLIGGYELSPEHPWVCETWSRSWRMTPMKLR